MTRAPALVAVAALLALAGALGWFYASPHTALARLAEPAEPPERFALLYDREALRAGFAAQTLPKVVDYPPPLTREVLLDAITASESVRLLVAEPYGAWQFAAAEGVPEALLEEAGLAEDSPMPRSLERTESWEIERVGVSGFIARPGDRPGGHAYRFERDGLRWRLVHIQLSEPIR